MHREQGFFPSHFTWKVGLSGAVSLQAMEACFAYPFNLAMIASHGHVGAVAAHVSLGREGWCRCIPRSLLRSGKDLSWYPRVAVVRGPQTVYFLPRHRSRMPGVTRWCMPEVPRLCLHLCGAGVLSEKTRNGSSSHEQWRRCRIWGNVSRCDVGLWALLCSISVSLTTRSKIAPRLFS
jgi:hypothetical protein